MMSSREFSVTRRGMLQAAAGMSGEWLRNAHAATDGTLTAALSDTPITCDPINAAGHDMMVLSQTVFENLIEFDIDGVLRPQLATAMPEIYADKLV
jgi:peptide/nickel transport system substrate-binding protein